MTERPTIVRISLIALAFALCLGLPGAAKADPEPPDDARFRLKVWADAEARDRLSAGGYDISGYALREGWVEVIARPVELERLVDEGYRVELIEFREGARPLYPLNEFPPLNDQRYTNPDELDTYLDQLVLDHPTIVQRVDLGTSTDGRTIWGVKISDNAATDEDELTILFSGAHHAREVMTPEVMIDTIDHLTDNYGSDADITAWVDAYEIWCIPMVNPDGVARVHDVDDQWRKNTRDNDGNMVIDIFDGVDLNRNYEWGWGSQCLGSSGTLFAETYRGPSEGSEPETQAMVALGNRIRPVFDVEYHSFGEDVFYAMSCDPNAFNPKLTTIVGPDQDISRVIAEAYAAEIIQADGGVGFNPAPFGSRVDGTGRDHQYHENGAIAFVTEVNSSSEGGFRPDFGVYRDDTVEGQRPGWRYLLDRIAGPAVGGHVVDAVTGDPIAADVSLDEMSLPDGKRLTSRGDTGRFHIIVVEGSYTLRASAPGYDDVDVPVVVGSAWSPLTVEMQPTGASAIVVEDFEDPASEVAWTVGAPGDTAIAGTWVRVVPHGTHTGDVPNNTLQFGNPRFDRTAGEPKHAFVTGNGNVSTWGDQDLDGGATTLTSPSYDLSGRYGVEIEWHRWFRNDLGSSGDVLTAEVSVDGGASWLELEELDLPTSTPDAVPAWVGTSVRLDDLAAPGADTRIRFRAIDAGADHVIEAAVDDLTITGFELATAGDVSGVTVDDANATVVAWGGVPGGGDATYDVVRGDLAALSGDGSGVDLGALACIEDDSADLSTAGDEDVATPAPGTAFFYLVRFQLGFSTGGFGAGSEGGERTGSGGCS